VKLFIQIHVKTLLFALKSPVHSLDFCLGTWSFAFVVVVAVVVMMMIAFWKAYVLYLTVTKK
jgi:hypothetical protein